MPTLIEQNKIEEKPNSRKFFNDSQNWYNYTKVSDYRNALVIKKKPKLTFNSLAASQTKDDYNDIFLGEKKYFPLELQEVFETIIDSQYIIDLEEGWGHHNEKPISREILISAIEFLEFYSKYILKHYLIAIKAPDISPNPKGTIDIHWNTKKARMLVNIHENKGNIAASYYGDFHNIDDDMPIKGSVPLSGGVREHLASWMRNLV